MVLRNVSFTDFFSKFHYKIRQFHYQIVDELYLVGLQETLELVTKPLCGCMKTTHRSLYDHTSSIQLAHVSKFQELITHNAIQKKFS